MLQKIIQLIRSLVILYIMLLFGNLISHLIPIGIPGSIWGLLLLFTGLTTQMIRLQWIHLGASLLIRFMAVLFVPVSVGIIKYAHVLEQEVNVLLIPNLVSSFLTLILIGLLGDYLFYKRSFSHKRKKALARRLMEAGK